jgi:hypothetical protein
MSQFGNMSDHDVDAVKTRLIEQIQGMSAAEIEIAAKSEDSLAFYIANAFKAFAAALGYVVALPLAWATRVAKEMYEGVKKGWAAGWRSAGLEW